MINFDPFWETLKKKNITTYHLIHKEGVASSTLSRIRNNKNINTKTLNDLCKILDCELDEIAKYIPDEE